ncbi:hypothetical protein Tco_0406352, partial [Tanacetum coccineum]
ITRGVVIQDTLSAPKPKSAALKLKLKGVQSLTPKEQDVVYTMQALKESNKTNIRQPGTGGLSKGTGRVPGVPDEEKKKDNDGDADDDDDEDDDHISDIQDTDNEDAKTE